MERQLQRLNWLTVGKLVPDKIDTVILPVGTIEAHGADCLGTDNFIPESISAGIAERANALVAPVFPYGVTKSLRRYNGSLTVDSDLFGSFVQQILTSLADTGFQNIIVMNGHGGNDTALKKAAYDFHGECQVNIAVIHWWDLCAKMTDDFFGHAGGHAGTDESAMVQAIDPTLVNKKDYDPELAWHFRPGADIYPVPGSILLYKDGEGYPEYDETRSRQYHDKVIDQVGEFVELILNRWRKAGF